MLVNRFVPIWWNKGMVAFLCDSVINYLYSDKNVYKRLLSFVIGILLSLRQHNCLKYLSLNYRRRIGKYYHSLVLVFWKFIVLSFNYCLNSPDMEKVCLDCGEPITGRMDKKFCSDMCRNNYNNRLNSEVTNYVRNVNNILRKNRRILLELIPADGKISVHKDKLTNKGFNFNYLTHLYTTQKGSSYRFVYEYGYLPLDNDFYMLVIREQKVWY